MLDDAVRLLQLLLASPTAVVLRIRRRRATAGRARVPARNRRYATGGHASMRRRPVAWFTTLLARSTYRTCVCRGGRSCRLAPQLDAQG